MTPERLAEKQLQAVIAIARAGHPVRFDPDEKKPVLTLSERTTVDDVLRFLFHHPILATLRIRVPIPE